jgi:hypothetical protein
MISVEKIVEGDTLMPQRWDEPFWIGERFFSLEDIAHIKNTVKRFGRLTRGEIVATLCENLPWLSPNGKPRLDACRQLLESMEASGFLELPAKRTNRKPATGLTEKQGTPLDRLEISASLPDLKPIRVVPVLEEERLAWNATMATYHPLGYQRAFGARQHYWIVSEAGSTPVRLGGLLFAASAKALQARDDWIGWDSVARGKFRSRIVSNSRYLILPGVHVPHLASHVLGLVARRIRADWQERYGFSPVLLETFVELPYRGTCYAAANWIQVGETVGRGRQDRYKTANLPRKSIWLYPLVHDWRKALVQPWPALRHQEDDEDEGDDDLYSEEESLI